MIKLQDLRLSDLLPEGLKTKEILAFVNAFDKELKEITQAINEVVIVPNIREQPEDIVDSLAWQYHVDFYEPLGLDLDRKRALVENSLIWHRHKGTKYALESIIRTLFFEDFAIEEWFEYGGEPYFFRLNARGSLADSEQYSDLLRAIHELKNERSWLEGIIVELPEVRQDVKVGKQLFPTASTTTLTRFKPTIVFNAQTNVGAAAFPAMSTTALTRFTPNAELAVNIGLQGFAWTVTETTLRDITSEELGALLITEDGVMHRAMLILDDGAVVPTQLQEVQN